MARRKGAEALLGVRWLSQGPTTGLGAACAAYMSGLSEKAVPVCWSPLSSPSDLWRAPFGPVSQLGEIECPPDQASLAARLVDHDTVVVCSTPLWHPLLGEEATGRRLVAYTAWETDRLAGENAEILNRYDAVFVPSSFVSSVLVASGVTTPVEVVPHCAPSLRSEESAAGGSGKFVFYTIATWSSRKAIGDLVEAFVRAFSASDDVSLVIHTTPADQIARLKVLQGLAPPGTEATWASLSLALRHHQDVPEVVLSTRRISQDAIASLHERGDCFVSLSRGEGWNLGAFDAGAHGKPVVVTGWGGHLDYLPDDYPYLVSYDLVPTTEDQADAWWSPRADEHWARADIDHAAHLMRHVYEHRREGEEVGAYLRSDIGRRFARPRVTETLVSALLQVPPTR